MQTSEVFSCKMDGYQGLDMSRGQGLDSVWPGEKNRVHRSGACVCWGGGGEGGRADQRKCFAVNNAG
jgi:hypothetical protein